MSTNYWKDRMAAALARATSKSIAEIEKQLRRYYTNTMRKTIADMESTYDKLMSTMEEGKEPTPADLYKLDKYWQMQSQLKRELEKLGEREVELFGKHFIEAFQSVYGATLPEAGAFGLIDTQVAQQMINQIWCADGKSWSQRIWGKINILQETLNEGLIACVVGGKKTTELKNLLQERFGVSYSQADALVRTEISHIQTQAAQKRYEDTGIQYVEVWADKDERRCEYCGSLHQKRFPVGAQMPVPAHPRCRCSILPVIE